jgi:hypothetical protein
MNTIGEIINTEEKTKSCREFNLNELLQLLQTNQYIFWSWGAYAFRVNSKKNPKFFRMRVKGHHHKGHVYIFLNGMDMFDVYLTTIKGKIVDKTPEMGIFFDQLVEWIDNKIEKVEEYQR